MILDASAVTDLLLRGPRGTEVRKHLDDADELFAPDLLLVEVPSALHRLTRSGQLAPSGATSAITALTRMPVRLVPHRRLLALAWRLTDRLRVADAFYVACAQLLQRPLVTTDARLARSGVAGVVVTLVR